ncbi:YciI family protein [Candidatus Uabimicrobium sp. HlEnr_7]|uniref:YciI family protein n=1 Tax=Candidatus Uabimicrobium helgolandensis TaxID=3095367 RepID=UPI003555CCCB
MKEYLVLIEGKMESDYAAENMPQRIKEFRAWVEEIGDKFISGQQLEQTGAYLKNNNTFFDGSFIESKEVIAGFVIITAVDIDEAISLAKSSPFANHFALIVRPLLGKM